MRALGYLWLMIGGWMFAAFGWYHLGRLECHAAVTTFTLSLICIWISEKFREEKPHAEDAPMDEQYTETPWDKADK